MTLVEASDVATQTLPVHVLIADDDTTKQRMIVGYLAEHSLRETAVSGQQSRMYALAVR